MVLPSWRDTGYATMKRAALWLVSEVGEGNVFTKNDLRDAFPDIAQIDRRMRDLRTFGWVIHTNREDLALDANQQRFVSQGKPVWEPGQAVVPAAGPSMTATARRDLMFRDGAFCRSCGIIPGQVYPGTNSTAQLDVARRAVRQPNGTTSIELVTECNRCRVGAKELQADLSKVFMAVRNLSVLETDVFTQWVDEDRREFTVLEELWADYRSLPAESRARVRGLLGLDQ